MRSRYSAYVKRLDAYLRFTWHPDTFPDDIALDPNLTWRGLEVLAVDGGGPSDDTGTVSFVASFDVMRGGVRRPGELRELSSFVRLSDDGVTSTADDPTARWVYVEELSAEA